MGGKTRSDRSGDATTHVPDRRYAQPSWLKASYQVVENAVRNILMKNAFVAEAPQVQLQAFQLQDFGARHVDDRERGEVRLSGHRADACELGTHALDLVLAGRMRVRDRDEFLRRLGRHWSGSI